MLDRLAREAPAAVGRWFPLSLPLADVAVRRFGLEDLREGVGGRAFALRAACDRARQRAGVDIAPGEALSAALLHAALRYVAAMHCEQTGVLDAALAASPTSARALPGFRGHFPPAGASGRAEAALELLLLDLAGENPAVHGQRPLFDDASLRAEAPVSAALAELSRAIDAGPPVAGRDAPLSEVLRAPLRAHPTLAGQLAWVRTHWADLLPEALRDVLVLGEDVLREETRMRGGGPGPAEVIGAEHLMGLPGADDVERFTRDEAWMPNVVLIAKLTHVWLDQLSKKHGRHIHRLDQIPDAELERLARWGFSGLWLIGLWERSHASRAIKQRMGNPEALSSAYSLHDYVIAENLGGEGAFEDLRDRAWSHGLRLGGDMVPNHMGMDARWVVEHPDRFLQLDAPPYPGYRFDGPDLCLDDRASVRLEDGYWDRSDAAVVFAHHDHREGRTRYIYHGNDGTQMPWNDTAQLDYLNPETREAVIQTILDVARRFPIIRFDAAMTLARQHVQRLWYPPPGHGGAIPSRAEHGALSPADFDRAMPEEFWREVVDRVQQEVPDTLLLAEAFWLMEGYFVRSLGMHRVYNSAFMNMLKDEENAKYRETIRNVLEFSPEVLQRFVNFMSNPDEQTAIEQFGKGDKYIGVAVLMVTLPGLPMFAHGQVEGFTEKYGMEYPRAYHDERPDPHLVARHEREVFPLMRRRRLFSGAANFALYDFLTPEGHVDENVFAYSNRADDERAVVFYNNAYATTRGRARIATPINRGAAGGDDRVRPSLVEALGLEVVPDRLYALRELREGLTYLRRATALAEEGLYVELPGYAYAVFTDLRPIDGDEAWDALERELAGRGVSDLEATRGALVRRPVSGALADWLGADADEAEATARTLLQAVGAGDLDGLVDADERLHARLPETASLQLQRLRAFFGALAETEPSIDLDAAAREALVARGATPHDATLRVELARLLGAHGEALAHPAAHHLEHVWSEVVADEAVRRFLRVNTHEGVRWFEKERMERLVAGLTHTALLSTDDEPAAVRACAEALRVAAAACGYRLDEMIPALRGAPTQRG